MESLPSQDESGDIVNMMKIETDKFINLDTTKSSQFCVHCSIQLTNYNQNEDIEQNNFDKLLQISSSSSPKILVGTCEILYKIFKLNYLQAFEEENDAELALCFNCSQVLSNLHQLYNDFHQLGQINSYLNQRLQKLDSIINCHQQKTISCDLIHQNSRKDDDDFNLNPNDGIEFSPTNSPCPIKEGSSVLNNLVFREPRIILKRLPTKYLPARPPPSSHANDDYDEDDVQLNEDNITSSSSRKSRSRTKSKSVKPTKNNKKKPIKKPNKMKSTSSKRSKLEVITTTPKTIKNKNYYAKRTRYPVPCWYCKRTDFSLPADCVEHTKQEHLTQGHVCHRCAKICLTSTSLTSHLKTCELIPSGVILPKKFQCDQCPKSFSSQNGLRSHILHHSTDRPFPCDECSYHGKTRIALNLHKTNKHQSQDNGESQKIKCDLCDTMVKNEILLKFHKINMHTIEGYQKYRERQKILLASLREKRKEMASQRSTNCQDCNVDLYSRLALINHRRSFHGDNMGREYICERCGRDFLKPAALKLHMDRVHSDARPFLCFTCGKGFKALHNLRNHQEHTHTTEGRLKYNEKMRERNRRRKILARQLANRKVEPEGSPTQIFIEDVLVDQ